MVTEPTPAKPAVAEKLPILVVDDEYGPRESIAFALASEFNVETSDRAMDALNKIRTKPFSLVVMDIRMPEMDGITALEELRKIDPHVSVIMLTGYGTLHTAQQAMVSGANQYLRKPPDIAELRAAARKQAAATLVRRRQAKINSDAIEMNSALKREIEQKEPQVWQARASVELVHDLNNPLTVVIGYATLLVEEARAVAMVDAERGRRLQEYANLVEKAAEYCHHLSENWRLASKQAAEFAPLDLVKLSREVQQVVFFGSVAINFTGLETAPIRGSKFELMRVFQNVFKNSLEAGATQLTVEMARAGDQIEMTVRDNGSGMDAERMKRALKGGFTSKENGTGLGLSICRHLLGTHGATMVLDSTAGQGSMMRMVFPAAT
ncbi:MAG: response regulator [Opitutaceae bacterium]